jgi:hypothetical protein
MIQTSFQVMKTDMNFDVDVLLKTQKMVRLGHDVQ